MSFTPEERIKNFDETIIQYLNVIFDLIEKIMDMMEKRNEFILDEQ